ncbi:hypothetical protein F8M41_014618 [Gigaspora margarita]|uniref:Uncharacterized protein n=1 Tax=Gigaspora margarita TaxID=4874 RepID=A0A8H4B3G9_GIGMA|nr:hypothetical protein F8M41_014618 [Gigaspora margarita]
MLQSKNNLQKLSSTGYITKFSYNFTISPVLLNYQTVWLYSPNDSDTQSQSSTISSEIDQLNRESENNQLELEYSQSHETNHQTKIIDLPHKDKHEVIVEMNKWEHAVRNDTCGELINNFGYISNQNGYVRNLDDEVYFSDNDLRIDSDSN